MAVRRVLQLAVPALLLFFLSMVSAVWGDSRSRIVRLSYVDGEVETDRGEGPERAVLNMPILEGMTVSTGENGHAEVEFENASTVRLAGYGQVRFDQLSLRDSGGKVDFVRVDAGTVYFRFRDVKREDDIRLVCGTQSFRVLKSSRLRVDLTGGYANLAVFDGKLELEGAPELVEVKKGETLRLNLDDQAAYSVEKGTDPLSTDEWDKDRQREHDEYARGEQYYNGYGSGDLHRYGSYTYVPGYGYGWRPYGVGLDWDPYGNGLWTSYSGCGYTWVSPYPWGWAPYRFGRWVWADSIGWAWLPGGPSYNWGSWYSWNCGPSIYGYVPPTYVVPVVPVNPRPVVPVPVHGTRPPRVLVVGNPPNVPRDWHPPGRAFPGGMLNTPRRGVEKPSGGTGTTPTAHPVDPRPIRSLDDGEVFVRGRVTPARPAARVPAGQAAVPSRQPEAAPASPGPQPVQIPTSKLPQHNEPVRSAPPQRNVAPVTPRSAPPAPAQTAPPVRSAPPPPVHAAPPPHVNPAPAPAPAPRPSFNGGSGGGGTRSSPPPSGGRR